MAEPQNQTLRILRDLRTGMQALDRKVTSGFEGTSTRFAKIEGRLDNIFQALNGEGILDRYAVAEVDDRLEAIEKRLSDLEKAD